MSTTCQYLVHGHKIDNKMTTEKGENTYNIDRKAASKLLKVSMRTVDRYVKSKKLSIQIINGRVWLNKKEIIDFKDRRLAPVNVDKIIVSTPDLSIDDNVDRVDRVDRVEVFENENFEKFSSKKNENSLSNEVYKKLYFDAKDELKEKQERLEIANYRVGQLEAQVKNSIPLLEYHRENYERKKVEEEFATKINESITTLKKLSLEVKIATFKKRMAVIILFTILALQPLWLLLIYKQ
jgi:aspartate carbamoyltransferase regulatory subunit